MTSIALSTAVLITLTAFLAWLNEKTLKLPPAIGVTLGGLLSSLLILLGGQLGLGAEAWAAALLEDLPFDEVLMEGMLSFLLFAGALHVDLEALRRERWTVTTLATAGVALSTLLVGTALWWALGLLGLSIPYPWALVFGALISPTDPIAVLAVLGEARTPPRLTALISGESLFNDGFGVVVFAATLGFALGAGETSSSEIGLLFVQEALGGLVFGLALGLLAYWLLKGVDAYAVEVLITLAVVQGGYVLAGWLHTSGPLAMVVAGLFLGNRGRLFAMSETTREHLDLFWETLDEILNAVLFLLIGLEVLILPHSPRLLLVALVAIPLVLGARLLAVGSTLGALHLRRQLPAYALLLMTWGGLRGGISVALALSIPRTVAVRDTLLLATYVVVIFSIVVQGLTLGPLARRLRAKG